MIQKKIKHFKWKKCKNKMSIYAVKDFASTYNVEIINCFNPELQLKDTESAS